ncbi:MAG TPA: group II truncated hemoglobin [Methylophilaceae bacterium]|nr:group II truncated hemoglobin [Methylophilaceae bacterium]HQR60584.1 group II truncated hemoglobin [Methylophilaceae bacterium]
MSEQPATFYEVVGGEEGLRRLVKRFYEIMDSEPRAAGIRAMHKPDLSEANEKLFLFLSGWMGGPPLYVEKYGHPMLRARHLPFPIGESERDQWVYCIVRAMHDVGLEEKAMLQLGNALWGVADFMRNQPETEKA